MPTSTLNSHSGDSLRLAAIDVGTNSLHMVVAQADADGGLTTLWRIKEHVGLGRLSFPSRQLSRDAIERAVTTLERFRQAAQQRQCEKIVCIATSAVREAVNGGDLIELVRQRVKLHVRVVSAREEARLIYLAVRHAFPLGKVPALILDIGGGSVEFIVGDGTRAMLLESRKLGAARMTAQFVRSDPLSTTDRKRLLAHYGEELGELFEQIRALRPRLLIGTSGTLESIAAMCRGGAELAGGERAVIDREVFGRLLWKLMRSDSARRAQVPGLDDARRDQIVAGALLLGEIYQKTPLRRMEICPAALREGILLDYLARHVPDLEIRREVPDPRRRSVIDLARRCNWHRSHSEHVAGLTLRLFDQTRSLHGLGAGERELIDYAALLHDIGWHIAREDHHKHSMYLIRHGHLRGFSEEEVLVIANIARYHRKSVPKRKHELYGRLGSRQRRVVDVGAGLLRIADGLDRSHGQVVTGVECRIGAEEVVCRVTARSDAELELWGARRKRELFESALGRALRFEMEKAGEG